MHDDTGERPGFHRIDPAWIDCERLASFATFSGFARFVSLRILAVNLTLLAVLLRVFGDSRFCYELGAAAQERGSITQSSRASGC